jgi:hypothetical protein
MISSYGIARHAAPARHRHAEPLLWLASGARRGWDWLWAADHDEPAAAALAGVARFLLLATLFFAVTAYR